MMHTLEEVEKLFADYVEQTTRVKTIFAKENGPTPGTPYIATGTTKSIIPVQHDIESYRLEVAGAPPDEVYSLFSVMRGLCQIEFQVRAYSGTPTKSLNRLRNSFRSTYFEDWIAKNQFEAGLSSVGNVLDISQSFIQERIEDRAEIMVQLYIPIGDEFEVDNYQSSDITIKSNGVVYINSINLVVQEIQKREDCPV